MHLHKQAKIYKNRMSYIFIHLMGGLGNQLFQYAAGFLQRKETNCVLFFTKADNSHDTTDYRNTFELTKYDNQLTNYKVFYQENGFQSWDPQDYAYPIVLFYGYFQNYSVLKSILPQFKETILNKLQSQRSAVLQTYSIPSSSGFIHIRRGDYVGVHNVQDIDYYSKAIDILVNVKHWFIFSDDIEWVKTQELFQNLNPTFVTETDPIMSLALMCEIQHGAIIANSSFSWWGAYLGGSDSVVYPKRWLDNKTPDLFPEQWVGI
jgi:hypothetical protein